MFDVREKLGINSIRWKNLEENPEMHRTCDENGQLQAGEDRHPGVVP